MLNYRADWQAVVYMVAATALLFIQWRLETFVPALYFLTLGLAFSVSIMHHNHRHVPMWRSSVLNRLSDVWFTLFQGHPGFVFALFHEKNHHRFCNGARDYTRTYRHRDDNSLIGLVMHPFVSFATLWPHGIAHLRQLRLDRPARWRAEMAHYIALFLFVGGAGLIDFGKTLVFIVIPQAFALFWLLGANYLQHAHTDETDRYRASRNFTGLVNTLFFNIGLHTAHHLDGNMHWSELPRAHRRIAEKIDKRTIETSLVWYCLRVFVLSLVWPAFRSRSLRKSLA